MKINGLQLPATGHRASAANDLRITIQGLSPLSNLKTNRKDCYGVLLVSQHVHLIGNFQYHRVLNESNDGESQNILV